jgi:hypothetical protein
LNGDKEKNMRDHDPELDEFKRLDLRQVFQRRRKTQSESQPELIKAEISLTPESRSIGFLF